MTPRIAPALLGPEDQRLLLTEAALAIRTATAFVLALRAGLRCREIVRLDVDDVSLDGKAPRPEVEIERVDGRRSEAGRVRIALPSEAQRQLVRYLAWKRGLCPHPDRPMRDELDDHGVRRCSSCGHVADFLRSPLFTSRTRQRMTEDALREEFRKARDAIGLDPRLHFDSLAQTFERAVADRP